jgi:hydrogenase small subunit
MAHFPGFGIEANADKIGMAAAAGTAAGIAIHAIATNVKKRKNINELIKEGKEE